MDSLPRVALFPDTYFETNGVATLSRQLVQYAQARQAPFMLVRGGGQTSLTRDGALETLELKRGPVAFALDKGLYCDPLLTRHKKRVLAALGRFKPDLIHITGPGDIGFLGLWVAHILHIPLVASWHTNLHEYLGLRLERALHFLPRNLRERASAIAELQSLRALLRFYRMARFTLAPNQKMVDRLHASTRRPTFLMGHGVDLSGYSPELSPKNNTEPFCIGYVGRLTAEKNVRHFLEIERRLIASGEHNYQFLIVGEGSQQKWLSKHLKRAEFAGVLRGPELAAAYRRMDAFVFPSSTDTFGLVVLEAMASGVPVIATPETGRRVGIQDGVSGFLSHDFSATLLRLMHDLPLRKALGYQARQVAGEHRWDVVFDQLYRIYAQGLRR